MGHVSAWDNEPASMPPLSAACPGAWGSDVQACGYWRGTEWLGGVPLTGGPYSRSPSLTVGGGLDKVYAGSRLRR